VKLLSSALQRRFQCYCTPATEVSIDAIIIRFIGQSTHTVRLPNKPLPEGYKVFALCEHGYIFFFMYTSRVEQFFGQDLAYEGPENLHLSPTSRAVLQLALALPYQEYCFTLFCDNYFSNIPLFQAFRYNQIAACGTIRPNSAEYPPILKINKRQSPLPWGTVSGILPEGRYVLAIIWQDKTLVRLLTTAYDMRPEPQKYTVCTHRPRSPRNRDAYRHMIDQVWVELRVRELALPTATVDYNMHMGGVDIADQRHSYYSTQLRVVRNWIILFFLLLDTTVINSFLIAQQHMGGRQHSLWQSHSWYRERLAWDLVETGYQQLQTTRGEVLQLQLSESQKHIPIGHNPASRAMGYITKVTRLHSMRKDQVTHTLSRPNPEVQKQPKFCLLCRFLSKLPPESPYYEGFHHAPDGPHGRI